LEFGNGCVTIETRMTALPECLKKVRRYVIHSDTVPALDRETDRQTEW